MASDNLENMTISELTKAMKGIVNDSDGLSCKTSESVSFPAMKVKFKGRRWTLQAAQEQLGFGIEEDARSTKNQQMSLNDGQTHIALLRLNIPRMLL